MASKSGKRYSAQQKAKILETARKEQLTGAEVRKRFGVSTLTFYRWRGPVRGRRREAPRSVRNGQMSQTTPILRQVVRAGVARVLPGIIREEVSRALEEMLGRRRPGRPRKRS